MTTLVVPPDPTHALWHLIWLNVVRPERLGQVPPQVVDRPEHKYPWLAPTRTSEDGRGTTPLEAHPLQAFFGMPRRVRLGDVSAGSCDLCGHARDVVRDYRARHSGVNYTGAWRHPLTPYRIDAKGQLISLKGRESGLTYRDWEPLVMATAAQERFHPATCVEVCQQTPTRSRLLADEAARCNAKVVNLWAAGYAMDNMKPLAWCEARLPMLLAEPSVLQAAEKLARTMVEAVDFVAYALRGELLKLAGATYTPQASVDALIERTTEHFYQLLLHDLPATEAHGQPTLGLRQHWHQVLTETAMELFDEAVLGIDYRAVDPGRIGAAANRLESQLRGAKLRERILELPKPVKTRRVAPGSPREEAAL